MLDTIEKHRGARYLTELFRCFVTDRTIFSQGLPNRTELAGGRPVSIADAILQNSRCEHVIAVKLRDLPVRNAVERLQRVETRLARIGDPRHRYSVAQQHGAAVKPWAGCFEWRCFRYTSKDRHHHGAAPNGDRLMVGGAGATLAGAQVEPLVSQPHPE